MIDNTEFKTVETCFEQLFVFDLLRFLCAVTHQGGGKTPLGKKKKKKVSPNECQIQKCTENVFISK